MEREHTARNVKFVGSVVLAFLVLFGIVKAVWEIDDHFISRREWLESVQQLNTRLSAIERQVKRTAAAVERED